MLGELLEAERVNSIVGGFFAVYNYFGPGLSESIYSAALELELIARGHQVARELTIPVFYHGRYVGRQRLDMVVDDAVVVENKARPARAQRVGTAHQLSQSVTLPGRSAASLRTQPQILPLYRFPKAPRQSDSCALVAFVSRERDAGRRA